MIAVVLAALAVTAAQVAFAFYLARKKDRAHDQALKATQTNAQLLVRVDELEDAVRARDEVIETLRDEIASEKAARAAVEEQRDALLQNLAEGGDARAVADAIRRELSALSSVPEVSGAAAPEDR